MFYSILSASQAPWNSALFPRGGTEWAHGLHQRPMQIYGLFLKYTNFLYYFFDFCRKKCLFLILSAHKSIKKQRKPLSWCLCSLNFRADAMALCIRASSCTIPAITTCCFATKDTTRGKTTLTLKIFILLYKYVPVL